MNMMRALNISWHLQEAILRNLMIQIFLLDVHAIHVEMINYTNSIFPMSSSTYLQPVFSRVIPNGTIKANLAGREMNK